MSTTLKARHPHYMAPKKTKPVCRTCFATVSTRAVHLTAHIDWHRNEGHRVKTEMGYESA